LFFRPPLAFLTYTKVYYNSSPGLIKNNVIFLQCGSNSAAFLDEILSSPSEDCLRLLQDYNQTTPELQFQNFVKNTVKFNIKPKDINKIERKLGMA
jgi:hypothetical protein